MFMTFGVDSPVMNQLWFDFSALTCNLLSGQFSIFLFKHEMITVTVFAQQSGAIIKKFLSDMLGE
jgi:hypothetical protein